MPQAPLCALGFPFQNLLRSHHIAPRPSCCDRFSEKSPASSAQAPRVDCQRIWCLGEELENLFDIENCSRRLTGRELKETMSTVSTSASSDGNTSTHPAVEECLASVAEMAIGDRSGAGSSREQKSEYFSPRVEKMMRSKRQFSSDVDHEIEHSKVHWSELTDCSELSEDNDREEEVNRENREVFAELINNPQWVHHEWGHFFLEWPQALKLGHKIAEGGQAEIFEVVDCDGNTDTIGLFKVFKRGSQLSNLQKRWHCWILQREAPSLQWRHHKLGNFFRKWMTVVKLGRKIAEGGQAAIVEVLDSDGNVESDFLLKVFKRGSRLSDLRKQWHHGILQREVHLCVSSFGTLLDDGRFAFLMVRCWGDLRKLIDQAMQEKNNQGSPFPYEWNGQTLLAKDFMKRIAYDMKYLHEKGIIHRDLKASNIFLRNRDQGLQIIVADFECSLGVVGTGFWRAPELLLALKNRSAIDFSEKMDVYSYAMTCFEVITGRLPFEGELEACRASNDLIIEGRRPKLPSDLNVTWKDLIERCWNPSPHERPSFSKKIHVFSAL